MRSFIARMLMCLVVATTTVNAYASETYYMIVFGSQRDNNAPRFSHIFATFVKVKDDGNGDKSVETNTISWLPQSMVVAPRLRPEVGRNFDLKPTLDWAERLGARVGAWGPYEIDKELFDSALRRLDKLQSGKLAYKMLDFNVRPVAGVNCIHALSDLDISKELPATGTARGDEAGALIVKHMRPWIIRADVVHSWLMDELRLDGRKIESRNID